jgi:hypothetical protein
VGIAGSIAWGKCNWTIYPSKPDPPCFNECCVRFLKNASVDELQSVLGVEREAAEKINALKTKAVVLRSLEEYGDVLSPTQFKSIERRLRSLD